MYPKINLPLIGPLPSHDLMVGLAVLLAGGLGIFWCVRREGLPLGRVLAALAILLVAVFAGGRLHFALTKWHFFEADPWRLFRLSSGGLHAPGAILGLALGGAAGLRLLRLPTGALVDGFAPAVGVGIALARIGCFLNGCCYGQVCALPWAVTLGPESYTWHAQVEYGLLARDAAQTLPIHPLPLYFAAAALSITAFLLWLRPRRRYVGQLGLWLLFLFSASSTLLEPIRVDHETRVYWGPLPQIFWVALAMTLVSGAALLLARRKTTSALE
ncbi:MAG: prolipoprotein diacylglyceryl transferase family protein [Deltaproteobacteria bacterium]